jgi:hypothetical protein
VLEDLLGLCASFMGARRPSDGHSAAPTRSRPDNSNPFNDARVLRPKSTDEYQQFPLPLGPPRKARKLIRFPINIPGDKDYVDQTPAWIDKMRTA